MKLLTQGYPIRCGISRNKIHYYYRRRKSNKTRRRKNDVSMFKILIGLLFITLIIAAFSIIYNNIIRLVYDITTSAISDVKVEEYHVTINSLPGSNYGSSPVYDTYTAKTLEYRNDDLIDQFGNNKIYIDQYTLSKQTLPDIYYGNNIDYSTFQPFMDYEAVTNTSSPAYAVTHSNNAYTDDDGFRRYITSETQFTINGQDDYIVALGTFYKEKGTAGERYLVVTTTGMFTIITGDEKSDVHTDDMNMFTTHGNGKAGVIEYLVDTDMLPDEVVARGTVTVGPVEAMQGEIKYLYKIS